MMDAYIIRFLKVGMNSVEDHRRTANTRNGHGESPPTQKVGMKGPATE